MASKTLRIMGKKRGMTQVFNEQGQLVPCTVIEAAPNVVTQIKTKEVDGYEAIQLGFDAVSAKDPRRQEARTKKPQRGHFKKNNVVPQRNMQESRLEKIDAYTVGQEIGVDTFEEGAYVDIAGVSKGKGFQGVIKLHNFAGGPAAHGSGFHRHAGSTGMRTTPGRCLPGGPRASHMGLERITVQNLKVIKVVKEENVILVMGSIPGPIGGLVTISAANKRQSKAKK